MNSAQSTFISSTFWTERIGPTASLKTLEVMEREKSWEIITKTGELICKGWEELAEKYSLPIKISGLPALANFTFTIKDWLKYKTFITQEMLKKNFLANNLVYVSTQHDASIIDLYFENLEPIFSKISDCENGQNIDDLLEGEVCHSGFERLN